MQNFGAEMSSTLNNKEIKQWMSMPPLSKDEERQLLEQFWAGREAQRQLEDSAALKEGHIAKLNKLVAKGKEARNTLVLRNLRLVISEVKQQSAKTPNASIPDMFSEGIIGLMYAIDAFDASRADRLTSCSVWWIRKYIKHQTMCGERLTYIPHSALSSAYVVFRAYNRLAAIIGRDPTFAEIASELMIPETLVSSLLMSLRHPLSLNEMSHTEDVNSTSFMNLLPDESADLPFEEVDRDIVNTKAFTESLLRTLPLREELIVRAHWAIGMPYRSLQELADQEHVTRQRISQMELKAMAKLRAEAKRRNLTIEGIY